MGSPRYIFLLPICILAFMLLLTSCEKFQPSELEKSMSTMHKAINAKDWPLAERLLQSILNSNDEGQDRWNLWLNLLEVRQNQEAYSLALLVYLESMLAEFESEEKYKKIILFKLADASTTMRQYPQAYRALEQLLALSNLEQEEQAFVYREMSQVNLHLKRHPAAKENLQACLRLAPLTPELIGLCKYELANILYIENQMDAAMNLANEIFNMSGISDSLRGQAGFILGDTLAEQGKREEALTLFIEIRNLYPNQLVIDNYIEYLKEGLPLDSTFKRLANPFPK